LVSREEIGVSQDAARLQTGLGLVHLLEADLFSLQREIELLDRGLWRDAAMPMAHWWRYLAAVVRLLRHDADAAPPLLEPNVEQRSSLYRRLAMDSLAIRAVSFQSRGRGRDARASLNAMAELAAQANDPCSHVIAASCHARIALMDGQLRQARERIETLDDAADRGYMFFWFETPRLTECRLLVAEASKTSLERTLSRLDRYERESRAVHNKLKLIEILTLKATALSRQGRTEQALACLREAVDLASPGWVTWPFVESGEPMADLLGGLAARSSTTGFIRLAIDSILNPDAPLPIERRKTPDKSLTEREDHVLNLLVLRLTDKEIARRLDVSPQTVNSHLKSIYRKLGVSSRRQAADAARALGTSQRAMGGAAYR
jgi:LuxR family maltose regulon positive regulatory protein